MNEEWVIYEHADWGEIRVRWGWTELKGLPPSWRWIPLGVEFDLFTPQEEKERILRDLQDRTFQNVGHPRIAPGTRQLADGGRTTWTEWMGPFGCEGPRAGRRTKSVHSHQA